MTSARMVMSPASPKKYSGIFKYYFGYVIPSNNFVKSPNQKYSEDILKSPENLIDIGFRRLSEKMSYYELDDGSLIKAKLDIKAVKKSRLPQQDGAPYYSMPGLGVWWETKSPEVGK